LSKQRNWAWRQEEEEELYYRQLLSKLKLEETGSEDQTVMQLIETERNEKTVLATYLDENLLSSGRI
jgi:hypothetical protein